jgi:REP element-mobilizing transposase RayT
MPQDLYYERHLPHQLPEGVPLFVTWNLKGAITRQMHDQIEQERQRLERQPGRPGERPDTRRVRDDKLLSAFRDRQLDRADRGPMHLKDAASAQIVVDSVLFGAAEQYLLYAFVVMANHVHVVLSPLVKFAKVMQGIKGATARRINLLQGQQGRVFWQDESYDHWVRDEEELARVINYVETNPVAAGLCGRPEDWPWSSARMRADWPVGEPLRSTSGSQPDVVTPE